jgi:hypothetical protein
MGEGWDFLLKMSVAQRRRLLEALAALAMSDRRVVSEEIALFKDFTEWLGVPPAEAAEVFRHGPTVAGLQVAKLPRQVRVLVFATGAIMVLVDGRFAAEEKRDLSLLASVLRIAPASALQTLRELRRRSRLGQEVTEALNLVYPTAAKPSPEQARVRSTINTLAIFLGAGVGMGLAPAVLPGAIVGLIAGAVGGGFLGNVVNARKKFKPEEYDFDSL